MAQSVEYFRNFKEQILLSVNTCFPASILAFDETSLEAKIQPLFMSKEVGYDAEKLSVLEGVPALTQRFKVDGETKVYKPVYQKGDVVLCVCAQRSLDNVESKKPYYAGKSRILDIQDAVIVGVLL